MEMSREEPRIYEYQAMGTKWKVAIWDSVDENLSDHIKDTIGQKLQTFEGLHSRFREDSLVSALSKTLGIMEVPEDFVTMLLIYKKFYQISEKKFTPCIGNALSSLGYDKEYSLTPKETVEKVPDFEEAVRIIDATHIELRERVFFDFGAVGKGYFVDILRDYLRSISIKRFLVDGSGDIYYEGNGEAIRAGLEHPKDITKVIGVVSMEGGAMCSSATNRRAWGKHNHYVDPTSLSSPQEIIATWVLTSDTSLADALTSLLFFIAPEEITEIPFEYCILNSELKLKHSAGFIAEWF